MSSAFAPPVPLFPPPTRPPASSARSPSLHMRAARLSAPLPTPPSPPPLPPAADKQCGVAVAVTAAAAAAAAAVTPADWLRANEAAARRKEAELCAARRARGGIRGAAAVGVTTVSRPAPLLAAGLLNLAGGEPWLRASLPSYCAVDGDVATGVASLESKVFYLGPVTRNKVVRAVEMAREVGAGSGEGEGVRMLSENVTVALIVADLQMDCETVCAAVLRGFVGRPGCGEAQVEREVGGDVLRILQFHEQVVQSVKLCVDPGFTEMSFSNLRELILVGAMDEPRAITLELARAVLQIRTLDALVEEEEKVALARRTMYLYAPLANQLGIWFVQGELEELAFMYLQPESYHMVRRLVGERRKECESTLTESKEFLERVLTTTPGVRNRVRSAQIKGRVKGLYSVYRKMRRSGKKVFEIYDLLALRVVVQPKRADEQSEVAACYAVADVIRQYYETFESRAKDYIATPKRNGYRSLHLTVVPQGGSTPLEIQIRTEKMHHVAEFGAAAHWIYKEKSGHEASPRQGGGDGDDAWQRSRGPQLDEASLLPLPPPAGGILDDETVGEGALPGEEELLADEACVGEGESAASATDKGLLKVKVLATVSPLASTVGGRGKRMEELFAAVVCAQRSSGGNVQDQLRKGYVTCLASAIRASRVIVATAGQLYGLAVGSTLLDLARGLGVASLDAIAVVNGSVAPLTQRLEMNDIVRFISALPEA